MPYSIGVVVSDRHLLLFNWWKQGLGKQIGYSLPISSMTTTRLAKQWIRFEMSDGHSFELRVDKDVIFLLHGIRLAQVATPPMRLVPNETPAISHSGASR